MTAAGRPVVDGSSSRAQGETGRLLGVAVVGVGFIGPQHVDAVRRGGYGEVRALVARDKTRTEQTAAALGVPLGSDDLDAVLEDSLLDVVHICTPNDSHVELARRALEAGKHIVVEKPLGQEIAAALELDELARSRGRHAMVAFTYRGYPMVRRAQALVQAGVIGEIQLVEARYLQDWLASPSDYNWRADTNLGGRSRAVADIGCHVFDTIEWAGELRVESVMADIATFLPIREHESGPVVVSSEDAATMLVRFATGARGVFAVSQVSPGRKNAFTFEIAGSARSLAWNQERPDELWTGARDRLEVLQREPEDGWQGQRGTPPLPAGHPEGWAGALRDLLRPFYAAIVAGERPCSLSPYPTLRDGVRAMAFVEAVLQSAEEGTWVGLPAPEMTRMER